MRGAIAGRVSCGSAWRGRASPQRLRKWSVGLYAALSFCRGHLQCLRFLYHASAFGTITARAQARPCGGVRDTATLLASARDLVRDVQYMHACTYTQRHQNALRPLASCPSTVVSATCQHLARPGCDTRIRVRQRSRGLEQVPSSPLRLLSSARYTGDNNPWSNPDPKRHFTLNKRSPSKGAMCTWCSARPAVGHGTVVEACTHLACVPRAVGD